MSDGSTVLLLLRVTVSLVVVLGLLVWAARAVSRRQGSLLGRPQRNVPVTVLGRQSLSRHSGLTVVEVGSEILVLGVTDAEVSLLTRLDPALLPESEPQDATAADALGESSTTPTFVEVLRRAAGDSLRAGAGLPVRRDVKRQAAAARRIADQLPGFARPAGDTGPSGGRGPTQGRHRD